MSKTWLVMDRGEIVSTHMTEPSANAAAERLKLRAQRETDITVHERSGIRRWWRLPVAREQETP
jgi:hypothetical protein